MKRHFLSYVFSFEYLAAALLTLLLVFFFFQLTTFLADYNVDDATSPLNPIASRIDFINIEDVSLDAIFAIKDMREKDRRIVIVNVGKVAPTPDNEIAALLHKLRMYGARVVGLDVLFDEMHFERFDNNGRAEIANLRDALRVAPNTVLAEFYDSETMRPAVLPLPELRGETQHLGHVNLERDQDEVVRRYYPYRTVGGKRWPSMAVAMARLYDPKLTKSLEGMADESQIIHYRGTWMQFPAWDLATVLERDDLMPQFKDRLVLVGYVNEGGLAYLDDTHKTPLGRKTEVGGRVGTDGPDMAGILIHANILNMILTGAFITPVPMWLDWLIALILIYFSFVLYRILRTKASSSLGLGILITVLLLSESVIVFFFPIIAFFYFDTKISYNIMATAVLLFIPTGAIITRLRFRVLQRGMRHALRTSPSPVRNAILLSFDDSEPLTANVRLLHAAQVLLAYATGEQYALRRERGETLPPALVPGIDEWKSCIPEVRDALESTGGSRAEQSHLFYYLHGKKEQILRESAVKDLFFESLVNGHNENFFIEEWEILLPYVRSLFTTTLRGYLEHPLLGLQHEDGVTRAWDPSTGTTVAGLPAAFPPGDTRPGVFLLRGDTAAPLALSPWCEYAECKLHRTRELFVFAGMLPKQYGLAPLPFFFGNTVCCEPVLPPWTLPQLQELPGAGAQESPSTVARSTP